MNEQSKNFEILSENAGRTVCVGLAIGKKAGAGDIFALSGELGAGKTCWTGGLARGLGVGEEYPIVSPTFTLVNEYPGRCPLYHFDVYRLKQAGDLDDLGYEEYLSGKGVMVVEWAEKIADALPSEAIWVHFSYIDENRRKIVLRGPEKRVEELVKDLQEEV
ncbi:MAG: tRNA (adenosine(37)-N6)-threonylcarbamoyltransferase complex ATPase subunit type 1 TsaE [Syntrophaceae bacterium]|jgi:tRNA threonylcarbamoyladenosine biosynthesis protein TsaE|nr:tRNA (adenosine(37)-N6)-threonylcarbamoyltransferase complex ATPase subunit type 1 TsaE [Syntrophaceae bacterium]HOC59936.1 tRNA (adenosine(37)-N6)-threonylcarbamoyltransferase complex ATPase subunit type 1 TsaE [Smithellaceae bacterium]HQM44301.1 tRNA (adenosine(37)-N6)-threonylcarbamoyltransferase complex ATPase subunit type 1 TsaE [Smithellaceae bacterium]